MNLMSPDPVYQMEQKLSRNGIEYEHERISGGKEGEGPDGQKNDWRWRGERNYQTKSMK